MAEGNPTDPSLRYAQLFRYATPRERGIVVVGCLAAAATGEWGCRRRRRRRRSHGMVNWLPLTFMFGTPSSVVSSSRLSDRAAGAATPVFAFMFGR